MRILEAQSGGQKEPRKPISHAIDPLLRVDPFAIQREKASQSRENHFSADPFRKIVRRR